MGWEWAFSSAPYGESWRIHRKLFQKYFNPNVIASYEPIQRKEVCTLLQNLRDSPDNLFHHVRRFVFKLLLCNRCLDVLQKSRFLEPLRLSSWWYRMATRYDRRVTGSSSRRTRLSQLLHMQGCLGIIWWITCLYVNFRNTFYLQACSKNEMLVQWDMCPLGFLGHLLSGRLANGKALFVRWLIDHLIWWKKIWWVTDHSKSLYFLTCATLLLLVIVRKETMLMRLS